MTSAVKKKPGGLWSISEDLHKMEKILFIAGIVHKNVRTQVFFSKTAGRRTTEVIIFGGAEMWGVRGGARGTCNCSIAGNKIEASLIVKLN